MTENSAKSNTNLGDNQGTCRKSSDERRNQDDSRHAQELRASRSTPTSVSAKSIIDKAIEEEYQSGKCSHGWSWSQSINASWTDEEVEHQKDFARSVSSRSFSDLLDEISKEYEAKRAELIELIKSDKRIDKAMNKIKRTGYEIGYSEAAGKGRFAELQLIESCLEFLQKKKQELEKW